MNTPKLRFKGFTDSWQTKKIKDIATVNQGLQIPISERFYENSENRFFYITNEFLKPNSKVKYFIENPPKSVLCNTEDVLMTRTGNTGHVVSNVSGAFHNNFFKINYNKSLISRDFLTNYLRLKKTQHTIMTYAGQSTIPDLNHSDFYKIKISYPNLKEQEKIGLFANEIERKIKLQQEKIELLKDQKKGYMQRIFSQELRFKDENGQSYSEWKEYKLKSIGSTFTGLSGKTKEDFGYGNHSFITYKNVFNNLFASKDGLEKVNVLENENQAFVQKGDILLTTSSETPLEVGMASIWNHSMEKVHLNSFCFGYRLNKNENILAEFIAISLRSDYMRKKIVLLAQGSTRFNMSKTELMLQTIMIPCVEEQLKIVNFYKSMDQKLNLAIQQLESLNSQKQAFMQQMFI
ncbi:restriction endonuclease subunit S [Niallia taxi]|uniref:restriction endonuclease subunit S n=1 Tax=Niallia taxi TaxID=2499688 RepID=UPI00293473CE|nr:restriction endonuclease subunit S [Niallia taxi]WOD63888.1 restriction endonuclease subunit S [Niallia taxi]